MLEYPRIINFSNAICTVKSSNITALFGVKLDQSLGFISQENTNLFFSEINMLIPLGLLKNIPC